MSKKASLWIIHVCYQIEISVEKTLDEVEINVPESLQSAETTSDGSFELVEHEEKEYVSAQGPQEVDPLSVVAGQEDTVEDVAQQSVENVENAAAESIQGAAADLPVVIKDGNMEAPANESDTMSQSPRHQESQGMTITHCFQFLTRYFDCKIVSHPCL